MGSDYGILRGIAGCNSLVQAMPRVISIANRKGGPSKTTSVINCAGVFAAQGLQVLVIDMDPQGSASNFFLGPELAENLPMATTVGTLFSEDHFLQDRSSLMVATDIRNLSIVANNVNSSPLDLPDPHDWWSHQTCILEFIQDECQHLDIVLLDFPPSLNLFAWAGLIASDYVAIPVPPEMFAAQGLKYVHRMITQAREVRPTLRRLGHFITRRKRSTAHREIHDKLKERFGNEIFDSTLSEYHAAMEITAVSEPLEQWKPRSKAAREVRELCREMLDRIEEIESRNNKDALLRRTA